LLPIVRADAARIYAQRQRRAKHSSRRNSRNRGAISCALAFYSDYNKGFIMSVARVTEITSSSTKSFDDALKNGIRRATKTLSNVSAAWVASQEVIVKGARISEYRVRMKVTFILK
jgi:flavin-binding protein dodecin